MKWHRLLAIYFCFSVNEDWCGVNQLNRKMSLFRKLLGNTNAAEGAKGGPNKGATPSGMQLMGAQLQRKFAKGVQYNSE